MFWMLMVAAWAGYGDAVDGHPNPQERAIHLWTNATRVDPVAFRGELPCWSSFSTAEREPKAPLALAPELARAARFHADDMADNDHFSHSSSDGTDFGRRVSRFYSGFGVGENISVGYPSPRAAVLGWLCSTGHRANIMSDWIELGTGFATGVSQRAGGAVAPYYVQNFGSRNVAPPPLRMGIAEALGVDVTFYVDYEGREPDAVELVLEGQVIAMSLEFGTDARGVWAVELPADPGCARYHFRARVGENLHRFPEEGAYGVGRCDDADDLVAVWFAPESAPIADDEVGDDDGVGGASGCASGEPLDVLDDAGCATAPLGGPLALFGLLLVRRRRTLGARPASR